jgi:hypothetical protein
MSALLASAPTLKPQVGNLEGKLSHPTQSQGMFGEGEMTTFISFARRRKEDSTVDSVCTRCYRTIATDRSESKLVAAEEAHFCEPPEQTNMPSLLSL